MKRIPLLICTAILAMASVGLAQNPGRPGYRSRRLPYTPPAGRTITPYLNYLRRDVGVLDPYNAWVRPTLNLNQFENEQRRAVRELDRGLGQVRLDVRQNESELLQIRETGVAPTGKQAGFMNYSHFFQFPNR
jgi:hypothetical protein